LCGNYGVAAPRGEALDKLDILMLNGLMSGNEKRGDDSTGVAFIGTDETLLVKDTVPGSAMVLDSEYQQATNHGASVALGHTRLATVGDVTQRNAHPFWFDGEVGSILGSHNGHVSNWRSFLTDFPDMEVDSEAIFRLLASGKAPKEVFMALFGGFACAWYNTEHPEFHLMRDDNPLYLLQDNNRKRLYWSSDYWAIHIARSMVAPEIKVTQLKKRLIVNIPVDNPTGGWDLTDLGFPASNYLPEKYSQAVETGDDLEWLSAWETRFQTQIEDADAAYHTALADADRIAKGSVGPISGRSFGEIKCVRMCMICGDEDPHCKCAAPEYALVCPYCDEMIADCGCQWSYSPSKGYTLLDNNSLPVDQIVVRKN